MLARRWRRETSFGQGLKHEIVVPAGPDGRPGERLLAPSASLIPPWPLGADGSREDFRVLLGRGGSSFAGVCLGAVEDRGDPLESSHFTIRRFAERGMTDASTVESSTVAGEAACRYRIALARGALVEWKFARRGWLFVVGTLCRPSDNEVKMITRAQGVLATWSWIEDDAGQPPTQLWATEGSVPPPPRRRA